jgi:hypothetical protein
VTRSLKQALVMVSLIALGGCAALPDVNKIQGNMDQMVHYMGVMASGMPVMVNSTARMANMAEQMQKKTDGLIADLQTRGGTAERAIQNYSQAVLDNERGVIKNLQGIRQELGEIKHGLRPAGGQGEGQEQRQVNAALQAKLIELEDKLAAVSSKLEKLDKKSP